jgi:hypothetical protein
MPLQLLYVDNGNIGINSRNQISGGAALYFYNTPYGWSTAAKTAIITEGINNYTMSKLHLCTNGVDDLTTSASVSNARLSVMPWGFVGINNTNPTANLDIIGSLRITSQTYAAITSGTGIDIIYSGGGSMSCGTRGVGGVLTAATMSYAASAHTFYTGTNAATNAMTINSSGQVGIGTATPQASLHVYKAGGGAGNTLQGEIRVCSDDNQISRIGCYEEPNGSTWGGFFQYNGGGTDLIQIGGKSNGVDTYFMAIQRTTGNMGINTTAPITKFNVVGGESVFNGNVYLNSNANTVTPNPATYWGVGIKMAAEDNGYTGSDFNVYVSWQGGGWYRGFRFDNTGRAYNYNNSWGGLSDINMKENIIDARNYLNDLRLLRVVKYSLKSDQLTAPNQLGLIAQEVEAIFPSLVSEDKDGLKYLKTSIIGMMQLKSIQELADKNDALEAKNAELTQKLERLMTWAQTQGFSG